MDAMLELHRRHAVARESSGEVGVEHGTWDGGRRKDGKEDG